MVIYTKYTAGGSQFTDVDSCVLINSVGENNGNSSFTAVLPNEVGQHKADFSIGQEFKIFANDGVDPPTTNLFTGIVGEIDTDSGPNKDKITISGRGYSARLLDQNIPPTVYNNTEVSVIVTNLISLYITGITTTHVVATSKTLAYKAFSQISVFDAIKELSEMVDYIFWVDETKDLHFEPKGTTSSGVTLDNTNTLKSNFVTSDRELFNEVYVYGNRVLSGYRQTFTADGGSIYNLSFKPFNTNVYVAGSASPKVGAVFQMTSSAPGSPTQYLVDFNGQRIVFVSGTSAGNNIPVSGSDAIVVTYERSTPIVKYGVDQGSISAYGRRTKTIIDKQISDPRAATDLLKSTLVQYSSPLIQGTIEPEGVISIPAGQQVAVNLPYQNIVNQTFDVIESRYDFTAENMLYNTVNTVKVSRRVINVLDTLKDLALDVKKLQAEDIQTTDVLTRLEFANGSFGMKVSSWYVRTRNLYNSFILGTSINGVLGAQGELSSGEAILRYRFPISGASIVDEVIGKIGSEQTPNSTFWVAGVNGVGSAIQQSGATGFNLYNTSTTPSFNEGSSFTLSFWHRIISGAYTAPSLGGVLCKGATATCNYGIDMLSGADPTKIQYRFGYRSGTTTNTINTPPLDRVNWNHIAGTFTGSPFYTERIYYNGVAGSVQSFVGSSFNGGLGSLAIGIRNFYLGGTLAGGSLICETDDVRIYNRDLSLAEIGSLYTTTAVQPILGDFRGALTVYYSGGE